MHPLEGGILKDFACEMSVFYMNSLSTNITHLVGLNELTFNGYTFLFINLFTISPAVFIARFVGIIIQNINQSIETLFGE